VSTRVTLRLEEDAPGSVGATADLSEITISPGETRTLSLTWDRVDLVPDYFVPGDVELCVEADRDGVPGIQDSDCATVTVAVADYIVSGSHTATDNTPNESDTTTVASGLSGIDSVAANISYGTRELDTSGEGEYPDTSTIRIELGGTTLAEKQWDFDSDGNLIGTSGSMPSGDHTFTGLGGLSGDLKILADEAEITLSAP